MTGTAEAQSPQEQSRGQAQQKAEEVGGQARDKAQEVAAQARDKGHEMAGETRSRLQQQIDERSNQAAERISSTGSDLRSVSEELRKQGKDAPARMVDQAADRAERAGRYLGDSDGERIVRDIENFGRRQPLVMLAGGMALGLAAARFLKASSRSRYQHAQGAPPNGTVQGLPYATVGTDVRAAVPDPAEHHQRFEGHV